ncbi:MAG TPA: low molecular weight protein-tyrosine-phosphatase [Rhodanobacteraceae bacterium]|jgi:protein-tyrosine phosphatase|nr:low molecular weight protein-tyrosine-phosphatase [Rhodanobacteraceae bacterium]
MISLDKPSILMICMGNICRSPIVESVARVELARAGIEAEVASAGTESYHVGERADPRAIDVAEAHGYPLSAHRARQVRPGDFDDYALILAMDRVNLGALAQHRPRGSVREPALFLAHAGFEGIDEVPDPYYGSRRDFERVLDLARRGCELLAERLAAAQEGASR